MKSGKPSLSRQSSLSFAEMTSSALGNSFCSAWAMKIKLDTQRSQRAEEYIVWQSLSSIALLRKGLVAFSSSIFIGTYDIISELLVWNNSKYLFLANTSSLCWYNWFGTLGHGFKRQSVIFSRVYNVIVLAWCHHFHCGNSDAILNNNICLTYAFSNVKYLKLTKLTNFTGRRIENRWQHFNCNTNKLQVERWKNFTVFSTCFLREWRWARMGYYV